MSVAFGLFHLHVSKRLAKPVINSIIVFRVVYCTHSAINDLVVLTDPRLDAARTCVNIATFECIRAILITKLQM